MSLSQRLYNLAIFALIESKTGHRFNRHAYDYAQYGRCIKCGDDCNDIARALQAGLHSYCFVEAYRQIRRFTES